jgi:SAM-dependent methyltransferase
MKPDFGAAADDYRRYRAGFPDSLFERLGEFGIGRAGQEIVDLGTGTGSLARGFARRGCRVIGIDPDSRLLAQARALDAEAGVEVDYRIGRAESTALAAASVDVVTAGQCWHWFDRTAAAREASRILRPDGRILIAHFDWIPLPGNLVEATEKLILAHSPGWAGAGGMGVYPLWLRDLGEAGFRDIEIFSYDLDVPYTPEAWRGRVRASGGVGGTLSEERVAAFDREFESLLRERFPAQVLRVHHRVFAVVADAPGRGDSPRT